MRATLRNLWESRTPTVRLATIAVTALLSAALYLWTVHSAEQARARLRASVTTLQALAKQVDAQANELERLRNTRPALASNSDLRTLVQSQADAAGLSRALGRIDAADANQVQVLFGSIAFTEWLAWIERLQVQQIRLDTCRIEALSTRGLVSVTATLVRARPK